MHRSNKLKHKLLLIISLFFGCASISFPQEKATAPVEDPGIKHSITTKSGPMLLAHLNSFSSKYVGMKHFLHAITLALLTKQNIFAFGPPGGAKTDVATNFLKAFTDKTFIYQMNEASRVEHMLGVQKVETLVKDGLMEHNFSQCYLKGHPLAVLDEVDKGPREVVSALLGPLQERKAMMGFQEVASDNIMTLATSNKSPQALLQDAKSAGNEKTMEALLDRFALKVLVPNRQARVEETARMLCAEEEEKEEEDWLEELDRDFAADFTGDEHKSHRCRDFLEVSDHSIDLAELQQKVEQMKAPNYIKKLYALLVHNVQAELSKKVKKEREEQHMGGDVKFPYVLPAEFSNRSDFKALKVMAAGKYLDGITKGDSAPTKWQPQDLRFAAFTLLTQAPGNLEDDDSVLAALKGRYADKEDLGKYISDIMEERAIFRRELESLLARYQDEVKELGMGKDKAMVEGKIDWTKIEKTQLVDFIREVGERIKIREKSERAELGVKKQNNIKLTVESIAREQIWEELKELRSQLDLTAADFAAKADNEKIKKKVQEEESEGQRKLEWERSLEIAEEDKKLVGAEERTTLSGHGNGVTSIAFSPDSKWLASGSHDNTIKLWDVEAGEKVSEVMFLPGHRGGVTSIVYSPDSKWLASGSEDNNIKLWDVEAGKEVSEMTTLSGHRNVVNSIAFSPDSKRLASGSWDKTIKLWNVEAGTKVSEITTLSEHGGGATSIVFSHDSKRLASGSMDKTIKLWNVEAGKEISVITTLSEHEGGVNSIAFSPDSKRLASGSVDRTIKLWNVEAGKEISVIATLSGHRNGVISVAFSPDGKGLASGSADYTIKLWNVEAGKEVGVVTTLSGHRDGVTSVAFSPDNKWLASGSHDRTIKWWNLIFK